MKFDGWPWKTMRHIFYTTSSIVHYFKSIGEFNFKLQSGNAQFGSKSMFVVRCDLEIWWMTLKNTRASLLWNFKLCALFHNHQWIQTRVTVRKCPIWVKISEFWSHMTLKFDRWPWKTIGHLFYATLSFVHHFIAICEVKLLPLLPETTKFGFDLYELGLWPLSLTFCMDITFVNGDKP